MRFRIWYYSVVRGLRFIWPWLNPIFRWVSGAWFVLGILALLRDEFLPQWAGIHVYSVLPNLGISGWLVVALSIGIVGISEAAFTHHQALDRARKRRIISAGIISPEDIRHGLLRRYAFPIATLVVLLLIVQFWPIPITVNLRLPPADGNKRPLPAVRIRSVRDLFNNDYRLMFSASMNRRIIINDGTHWKLEEKVFWYGNEYFVGFWVPNGARSFEICQWLAQGYTAAIGDLMSQVSASEGMLGSQQPVSTLADLRFNGTVYIYHDEDLSQERKAILTELFRRNHASLVLRGPLEVVTGNVIDAPKMISFQ